MNNDYDVSNKQKEKVINFVLNKLDRFSSKINSTNYITVVDFTQPSYKKRLYVYDTQSNKVIRSHHVSHGKNSASRSNKAIANQFSNQVNSLKSCLGAFRTAETYTGKHGYSLRLDGLEETNDNARRRDIVIHPADYVTNSYINKYGRAGLSWGCPAVDPAISKSLIDLIKDGQLFYIYF